MVTRKRLRELVAYNPKTGEFTAQVRRSTSKVILGCKAIRGKRTYLRIVIDNKHYYAHRLAWLYVFGEWPNLLDHVNGDGCDNRIANLRKASHSENHANTDWRRDNKTGFKCVNLTPSGRFVSYIRKDGQTIYLGTFNTPEEAHAAYITAARKLFGDFANAGSGG